MSSNNQPSRSQNLDEEPERIQHPPAEWNSFSTSSSRMELLDYFLSQGHPADAAIAEADREFAARTPRKGGQQGPGAAAFSRHLEARHRSDRPPPQRTAQPPPPRRSPSPRRQPSPPPSSRPVSPPPPYRSSPLPIRAASPMRPSRPAPPSPRRRSPSPRMRHGPPRSQERAIPQLASRIPSSFRSQYARRTFRNVHTPELFREWTIQAFVSEGQSRQRQEEIWDRNLRDKQERDPRVNVGLWFRDVLAETLASDRGMSWEDAEELIDYNLELLATGNAAEDPRQRRRNPSPSRYGEAPASQGRPRSQAAYISHIETEGSLCPTGRFADIGDVFRLWVRNLLEEQGQLEHQFPELDDTIRNEQANDPSIRVADFWRGILVHLLEQKLGSKRQAERMVYEQEILAIHDGERFNSLVDRTAAVASRIYGQAPGPAPEQRAPAHFQEQSRPPVPRQGASPAQPVRSNFTSDSQFLREWSFAISDQLSESMGLSREQSRRLMDQALQQRLTEPGFSVAGFWREVLANLLERTTGSAAEAERLIQAALPPGAARQDPPARQERPPSPRPDNGGSASRPRGYDPM